LESRAAKEPNNDNEFFRSGAGLAIGDDLHLPATRPLFGAEPSVRGAGEYAVGVGRKDCVRKRLVSRRSDPGGAVAEVVGRPICFVTTGLDPVVHVAARRIKISAVYPSEPSFRMDCRIMSGDDDHSHVLGIVG